MNGKGYLGLMNSSREDSSISPTGLLTSLISFNQMLARILYFGT